MSCSGTGQDIQCNATGTAAYAYDENAESGALIDHRKGSHDGVLTVTLEVGIVPAGEESYYIMGVVSEVPGAYDMVQITRHDAGPDTHVIKAGTDIQNLDPGATAIIFDQDLPLQAPAPQACPNPRSTGTHHFRLVLAPRP